MAIGPTRGEAYWGISSDGVRNSHDVIVSLISMDDGRSSAIVLPVYKRINDMLLGRIMSSLLFRGSRK